MTGYLNSGVCTWIFGRGASIECGLDWVLPESITKLNRRKQIECIYENIPKEMEKIPVGKNVYSNFLAELKKRTNPRWCHQFITTNWDYLLQREINNLDEVKYSRNLPKYLRNSWVDHLNGSADRERKDNLRTCRIVLETDSPEERSESLEFNLAMSGIAWSMVLKIVVGLSLNYKIDQSLFFLLNNIEDTHPIGESAWLIINPEKNDLNKVDEIIKRNFPRGYTKPIETSFKRWLKKGMPELSHLGIMEDFIT